MSPTTQKIVANVLLPALILMGFKLLRTPEVREYVLSSQTTTQQQSQADIDLAEGTCKHRPLYDTSYNPPLYIGCR